MYGQRDAWAWRDWKTFLGEHFKSVDGIRKYNHHFRFDTSKPGVVFLRMRGDDRDEVEEVLKSRDELPADTLPPMIQPAGFTQERIEYLRRHVLPLVRPAYRSQFFADNETEE